MNMRKMEDKLHVGRGHQSQRTDKVKKKPGLQGNIETSTSRQIQGCKQLQAPKERLGNQNVENDKPSRIIQHA